MYDKLVLVVVLLLKTQFSLQDALVEIPNGQLQGREETTSEDKAYYAFEKIPYAAPPVGDLRFVAPRPVENWEGVLNATHLDIACFQISMFRGPNFGTPSEDCLFLNVYTPKLPESEDEELLPVMVWIYGGGFEGGSAVGTEPDLFINNDVLLVAMNYRVGIFGFLSTQDDVIPGNNGLKDQAFALQWVQDNIAYFGGDPKQVTIFGQSAGGGSVAYQLLNQNNEGLFRGAIIESGSFLSTGMFQRNSRSIAFGTGAVVDPTFETSEDSEALLELLRSLDSQEVNEAAQQYSSSISTNYISITEPGSTFAPVVEAKNPDAFITKKMYGLLKAGSVLSVPVMMGFVSEEKIGMALDADDIVGTLQLFDENLDLLVPNDIPFDDAIDRVELGSKIREIYTGGEPLADHVGDGVRYASDTFITRALRRHGELSSQYVDTYFFQFSFEGDLDAVSVHFDGAESVGHGSELTYLFCSGTACTDSSISEADLVTRQRLITLWTNFAKYQNPTPEPSEILQNVTWPKVSTEEGDFLYLDISENLEVKNHPKEDSYSGWIELYESIDYDDWDTY